MNRREVFRRAGLTGLALAGGYVGGRVAPARAYATQGPFQAVTAPPGINGWTPLHFNGTEQWDAPASVSGAVHLEQAASPGYGLSMAIRPVVAAAPYTFDLKLALTPMALPVDRQRMGLILYDQSSLRVAAIQLVRDSAQFGGDGWGVEVVHYNDEGITPTIVATSQPSTRGNILWLRAYQDSASLTWQLSQDTDPGSWETISSEPTGSFIRPTHGGIGVAADHAPTYAGDNAGMLVQSWDETAAIGTGKVWIGTTGGLFTRLGPSDYAQVASSIFHAYNGVTCMASPLGCPSTLYVSASSNTIYKSIDGGVTWNAINRPSSQVLSMACPDGDPNTLYVASGYGLFKSPDGGTTWTTLSTAGFGSIALAGSRVWAQGNIGSIWWQTAGYSDDQGATWTAYGADPAQDPVINSVRGDPNHGFVIQLVNDVILTASPQGTIPTASYTGWAIWQAARPSGVNVLYIYNGTLRRATSLGGPWTQVLSSPDLVSGPAHGIPILLADPTGSEWWAVGANGHVFHSTDDGVTWAEETSNALVGVGDPSCLMLVQ